MPQYRVRPLHQHRGTLAGIQTGKFTFRAKPQIILLFGRTLVISPRRAGEVQDAMVIERIEQHGVRSARLLRVLHLQSMPGSRARMRELAEPTCPREGRSARPRNVAARRPLDRESASS
jgi:hypothetical protein